MSEVDGSVRPDPATTDLRVVNRHGRSAWPGSVSRGGTAVKVRGQTAQPGIMIAKLIHKAGLQKYRNIIGVFQGLEGSGGGTRGGRQGVGPPDFGDLLLAFAAELGLAGGKIRAGG